MSPRFVRLVGLAALVGCGAPAAEADQSAPLPPLEPLEPPPPPGPAQKLRLELSLPGHAVFEVGEPIVLAAAIRNRSPEPQAIVLPGSGSTSVGREPYVRWLAYFTVDGGQQWLGYGDPAPPGPDIDAHWQDEVVTIPPGGVQPLGPWIGSPGDELALDKPGRLTVILRYVYEAGAGLPTTDLGAMAGTPAFELQSTPLQLELIQPLALTLAHRPGTDALERRPTRLAQLFQLEARNNTDAPITLPVFTAAALTVRGSDERHDYTATKPPRAAVVVPPGATVVLPDLAAFKFPWTQAWFDAMRHVRLDVTVDGWPRPVKVDAALLDSFHYVP